MTQDEKLNKILFGYLHAETLRLSKDKKYAQLTFEFITNSIFENCEDWEKKYFKQRLFEDGYLKESGKGRGEPYLLTNSGKKFIQTGGYIKGRERQSLNDQLQNDILLTNKFARIAVIISILSLIVSAVALIKQLPVFLFRF